jgi:3'-phosphoadenosine 5'-phosphosulfate sulfotransferase (PAPS reductase)/FAD synthetase
MVSVPLLYLGGTLVELIKFAPDNLNIVDSMLKARSVLSRHRKIAVSVSGGSDSDNMIDLLEMVKPADCVITYVFFDTGLEYDASKRQLDYLETKYGITIERLRAKKTVAAACREYGVPFISKDVSAFLSRLQAHNFDWTDSAENATPEKYGKCKSALDWYFDSRAASVSGKSLFSIRRYAALRDFISVTPPTFSISDKCCYYAKKRVAYEFNKKYEPDLIVTGMRRAEGGRRAGSIKSCFSQGKNSEPDNYRPIWYWRDEDKVVYKHWRGLRYSDCYEVWGLHRTGCCGCPCNSGAEQELEIVEQYEPLLTKAARAIFSASYAYKLSYRAFKQASRDTMKAAQMKKEGIKCIN